MADFKSREDVKRWVEEREDGHQALVDALLDGRFSGRNFTLANAYNNELIGQAEEERRQEQAELDNRMVVAAEVSAKAAQDSVKHAEDSAKHAGDSARSARLALVLATVALVVSVGPQIGRLIKSLL